MPLAINTVTGIIRDYPINVIQHRVLGVNLELYFEDEEESDKVVIAKKVLKKKSDAPAEDNNIQESNVTNFSEVAE